MVLKRVGAMSLAKISGVLYAAIGLIIGAVVSLFAMLGMAANLGGSANPMGMLFGVGAIICLPIFYGLIGFIGALIGAGLYNVLAGVVGGVRLDLE